MFTVSCNNSNLMIPSKTDFSNVKIPFIHILSKIYLAIVLYGPVHLHPILSFNFWNRDASADHSTRISMLNIEAVLLDFNIRR